nr:hypothetical protein [Mycoplasmopsis bovis]
MPKVAVAYNLGIMNEFDIDIFDEVLNTTKSLYAAKAKRVKW